ncbi:hypothetical protein B0J14DRAFT_479691, partial [Halenospora varia]
IIFKAQKALQDIANFLLFATLRADASTILTLNGSPCSVDTIVARDVCVIGGGSTRTYSAIRLSDLGKTVTVVEEKSRLGGHTETYTDPTTGGHIDISVVVWHVLPIVKDYFSRLNVSLPNLGLQILEHQSTSTFSTGKSVPDYIPTDPTPGLTGYAVQLAKYPYLEEGFAGIPYPVPHDLLLPFGQFVKNYKLESFWAFCTHLPKA